MGMDAGFTTDAVRGIPVVHIAGDLDHHNLAEFKAVVTGLLENGHSRVVLDMAGVDYMDSGGMSGLVFALKRLSAVGGCLKLANCNSRVLRKLEIGGLSRLAELIGMCGSTEQAISECEK